MYELLSVFVCRTNYHPVLVIDVRRAVECASHTFVIRNVLIDFGRVQTNKVTRCNGASIEM